MMPRSIKLTVYGNPVAKGRARTVRTKNGKIMSYTPDKTAQWEQQVAFAAAQLKEELLEGPLKLVAVFYLPEPKHMPKGRKGMPACRPDLDNYIKSIADPLNGILYSDDAQIVEIDAKKVYGHPPRAEIEIMEVGE